MKKIVIEDVNVGVSEGGIACGPVGGNVVVEARIRKAGNKVSYFGMVEVDGMPMFYESEESRFEKEMTEDYAEGEVFPEIESFEGYDDFYEQYEELAEEDKAYALLLKYLICLARLEWEEVKPLKDASIGKAIGSFDIPVCDAEQEYIDINAEDYDEDTEEDAQSNPNERVMSNFDKRFKPEEGIQWLSGIEAITSEVRYEDNGKPVFIFAEWITECPEDITVYITDESIYDLSEMVNYDSDKIGILVEKRREILDRNTSEKLGFNPYEKYYDQIIKAEKLVTEYAKKKGHRLNIDVLEIV